MEPKSGKDAESDQETRQRIRSQRYDRLLKPELTRLEARVHITSQERRVKVEGVREAQRAGKHLLISPNTHILALSLTWMEACFYK